MNFSFLSAAGSNMILSDRDQSEEDVVEGVKEDL